MSMFRDRETELSEVQRLVAKLAEPSRRHELSAAEWPLAMVAYALQMSEDPALLGDDALAAYAAFVQCVPAPARRESLAQLAQFITARRGAGWRALMLYVVGESADPALCGRAAAHVLTLAAPGEDERFAGAAALVQLMCAQQGASPAVLGALLAVSDMRLLPLVQLLRALPLQELQRLIRGLSCTLNSLSAECLLQLLEAQPALAEDVCSALARMAAATPLVADLVYPMPVWAYEQPAPQPLHAWTLQEFLPRMLPRLQPHMTAQQLDALQPAFA